MGGASAPMLFFQIAAN
ncbi:DUF6053 domain-containing protein [Lysobacter capsici]